MTSKEARKEARKEGWRVVTYYSYKESKEITTVMRETEVPMKGIKLLKVRDNFTKAMLYWIDRYGHDDKPRYVFLEWSKSHHKCDACGGYSNDICICYAR